MKAFAFVRPTTPEAAVAALQEPSSVLKANGVDLLDRMKERVDEPDRVVALLDVPGLATIAETQGGGVRIGAMVTLQTLADDDLVRARLPSLAKAAGLAASPQLRRRATVGGNLAQHTRCGYYRHLSFPCWKRGADACPVRAETGVQDTAGIFGNASCASAHPSSLAPVLGSVSATIHVQGPKGARALTYPEFWAAPARGRASDLALDPAEVITAVEVTPVPGTRVYGYEEVRVKSAFDWALVSAAVSAFGGNGRLSSATIFLGSVAPTPHRALAAEALVAGTITDELATKIGEAAAQGATPLAGNAYKVQLVKVAVKRAVLEAAGRPA
jgi:xanthine dehydrogenase YagS FAD-binding subunit